ncbi:MAG: DUF4931 domain-containing protein [Candidatus Gribaldobacteria bacterium]|nr:DUF4931 domain-containing protein [Candidatus Gribaldobacteria bacterium]
MSQKSNNELRLDPISGDWVVVATGRAKRFPGVRPRGAGACPFCVYFTSKEKNLGQIVVIPNKFPAFSPVGRGQTPTLGGLFQKMPANGFHEVVITKSHTRSIADFSLDETIELLSVYQSRYLALAKEKVINYIFIFHNHGPLAGASISHPHSQIIATSLVDGGFLQPLKAAEKFFSQNKKCLYCSINQAELKSQERIVAENDSFVALCPFASKMAFEIMIAPKKHSSHFEKITEEERSDLADILRSTLAKIKKGLNNPDYNFYIRTAPCDSQEHDSFHWHLTILPKTQTWAGFELGAGMEIITTAPEQAAQYLRKVKI